MKIDIKEVMRQLTGKSVTMLKHNKFWTNKEDRILKRYKKEKKTHKEIGLLLKRYTRSVRAHCGKLGLVKSQDKRSDETINR